MKRSWQTPQFERVGNLSDLVVDTIKISGNADSGGGDPTATHKHP